MSVKDNQMLGACTIVSCTHKSKLLKMPIDLEEIQAKVLSSKLYQEKTSQSLEILFGVAAIPTFPLSSLAVPAIHEFQSRPAEAAKRQAGGSVGLPPTQPRQQAAGLQL